MILQSEGPRILAHYLHILPPQTCKSFPSYFAEGGREIDEVYAGEELGNIDELGHGLDIPACAATDLREKMVSVHDSR